MPKPVIVLLAIAAVVAALYAMTMTQAGVTCEVCMGYQGLRACATAAGATEQAATASARTTACARLTAGVTATIRCDSMAPLSRTCEP